MVLQIVTWNGKPTGRYGETNNIKIGDIVKITGCGTVYPTYERAFKFLWGSDVDGFHTTAGSKTDEYISPTYGNYWKVCGMCVHGMMDNAVLAHLKDRLGRNLLIDIGNVRLVKKGSPKIEQPHTLTRINHNYF